MPAELWGEAVSLAQSEGVAAVARALRVDYKSLARRVDAAERGFDGSGRELHSGGRTGRGFVEFRGAQLLGAAPAAREGTVVEMIGAADVRVTIRLGVGEKLDVGELLSTLVAPRP